MTASFPLNDVKFGCMEAWLLVVNCLLGIFV